MTNIVTPSRPSWLTDADFKGCTNPESGARRIKASVVGINDNPGQDWRLLCDTTPFTWNHTTYNSPTHCKAPVSIVFSHVLCCDINILTELLAFSGLAFFSSLTFFNGLALFSGLTLGKKSRCGIFPTQAVNFAGGVGRDGC